MKAMSTTASVAASSASAEAALDDQAAPSARRYMGVSFMQPITGARME